MDQFGVPKKINRHVLKAIYEIADEKSASSNLSNICDTVELSMRNNVPVPNLLSAVRLSLLNLCRVGVIKKKGQNYYRHSENATSLNRQRVSSKKFENAGLEDEIETLNPRKRKRSNQLSEDAFIENFIPRPSGNKLLSRKGKEVHLPRVRKHTSFQMNHSIDEMEQDTGSSSEHGSKVNSEDENANKHVSKNTKLRSSFSEEIVKVAKVDAIESDHHSENILHSLVESSNVENNHLKNFDYDLLNDPNNNFDVLSENQSQLPEINRVSDSSPNDATDVQNESVSADSKEESTTAV